MYSSKSNNSKKLIVIQSIELNLTIIHILVPGTERWSLELIIENKWLYIYQMCPL